MSYVVAVPFPSLTRTNKAVSKRKLERATELLLKAFGEMFGGATAMPCLGTWEMLDGSGLAVDRGQTVVVSMTTREAFLKHRERVAGIVSEVGDLLDQEGMAVIAYSSADGFLLLPDGS